MKLVVEQFRVAVAATILVGTLMAGTWIFFIVGPMLETDYWPVVKDGMAIRIEPEDELEKVHLLISGNKQRRCRYISSQLSIFDGAQWVPSQATASPQYVISDLPHGIQVFGIYHLNRGWSRIRVESTHRCHFLWDSTSVVLETNFDDIHIQR